MAVIERVVGREVTGMPLGPESLALRRGPYLLLVLAVVLSVVTAGALEVEEGLPYLLGLSVVLGLLHYALADRRWQRTELNDATGRTYLVVRTVLAFLATALNPFFSVFATVGYFDQHLYVSRRWGLVTLTGTAVTMAGSQSGGFPPRNPWQWGAFGVLLLLNLGLVTVFSRIAEKEQNLAAERDGTIAELERANTALQAALTENARLQEELLVQARRTGVRDERERLALEIHDTIAQSLIGVVTQLQAADDSAEPDAAGEHRRRAADLAREALGEARRSVQGLRPAQLNQATLGAALKRLVEEWSLGSAVAGEFTVTGDPVPLSAELEATVLRVAQESLANVAKHAAAQRVGVTLSYMDGELVLDVRDDGAGFDPAAVTQAGRSPESGGMGLDGMRQRAERCSGVLVVESEIGGGTAISLRVPAGPDWVAARA
ncbi:sensor histidine kinase [Kineosporia rhizophila]|uniref:sensor histidine kinase n=1 Tax=Kineosporia TaxID=49184 RepID=UPI001E55A269|nr:MULTISPECIES: sensor histidine kinase [Kineosporia]MCE0536345.1 sensor histidine kinase [Kineosporia rhizophila]GLY19820.1 histidine kinase [Kineosporia sp. NBRC 101677]